MQIKTIRCHLMPIGLAKIRKLDNATYWQDGKQVTCAVGRDIYWSKSFWRAAGSQTEYAGILWSNDPTPGEILSKQHLHKSLLLLFRLFNIVLITAAGNQANLKAYQ